MPNPYLSVAPRMKNTYYKENHKESGHRLDVLIKTGNFFKK